MGRGRSVVRVVSGALIRRGKILMGLRRPDTSRPCMWETPGGKVERADRSATDALRREWMEEIGISIVVDSRAPISRAVLDLESRIVVDLYEVAAPGLDELEIRGAWESAGKNSHSDLAWFDLSWAIVSLPCAPATYLHYQAIRKLLDSRRDFGSMLAR